VKQGSDTVATLEPATEITVTSVQGDWVGVAIQQGERDVRGWIHRTQLELAGPPAIPDTDSFPQPIRLITQEKVLGEAPEDMIALAMCTVSPNGSRVGFASVSEGQTDVFINSGKLGTYDEVHVGQPAFSRDSRRYAFAARTGNGWRVIVDGKAGPLYDSIQNRHPVFSLDGKHVAYSATRRTQAVIVIDNDEYGPYDAVQTNSLVFSPDSSRAAYVARQNGNWFAVTADSGSIATTPSNDTEGFDEIARDSLLFSPDSKRIAFAARRGQRWIAVLDGVEHGDYQWVGNPVFDPQASRLIYETKQDGTRRLAAADAAQVRFSDDRYDAFGRVVFSPDGSKVAYPARIGGRWLMVFADADGTIRQNQGNYDACCSETLVFSADSKRSAYVAVRDKKALVVIDGKPGPAYDYILAGTPVFSRNSQRVAYAGKRGRTWHVVADGRETFQEYGLIKENTLQFTPDARHLVCIASYGDNGRRMAIAVDGELSEDYMFPVSSGLVFDGPTSFHTLAVRGDLVAVGDGDFYQIDNGVFLRIQMAIGPQ
jgi:hypothetical protein